MATDISELIVKIQPQGVEETTEQLESQADAFTDTAETAEEQTGILEDFSKQWKGAMSVFAAALGIATATLASRVPILSELWAGLEAILTSVGLQIDQFLRPILTGLVTGMFDLAAAIGTAEGFLGDLIGAAGTLIMVLGTVEAGVIALNALLGLGLPSIIGTLVGLLGGPLTAALLGLTVVLAALLTDWEDTFERMDQIISDFLADPLEFIIDVSTQFLGWVGGTAQWIIDAVAGILPQWTVDILTNFAGWAGETVMWVLDAALGIASWTIDVLTSFQKWTFGTPTWLKNLARGVAEFTGDLILNFARMLNPPNWFENRLMVVDLAVRLPKITMMDILSKARAVAPFPAGGGLNPHVDRLNRSGTNNRTQNRTNRPGAASGGGLFTDIDINFSPEGLEEWISTNINTNVSNRGR